MDANGTRYHLLLGERDWTRTLSDPVGSTAYDAERGDLTLRPLEFRFALRPGDRPSRLGDRRGAAADAYGNVYWIDVDGASIRAQSAGSGRTSLFWQPGLHAAPSPDRDLGAFAPPPEAGPQPAPPKPMPLAALAVTEDHYLVVGTIAPAGILIFDLHAAGPPRHELWPQTVAFRPYDMCERSGGGAFVLDARHRRLWELDRHLLVVARGGAEAPELPATFGARDAGAITPPPAAPPPGRAHRHVRQEDGVLVAGTPIAVETAPGGGVLVLDRPDDVAPSSVRLLHDGIQQGPAATLEEPPLVTGDPVADELRERERLKVVAHDMALMPAGDELGTLYVVDRDGNQAFAFRLTFAGGALRAALAYDYFPMRLFGGKAIIAGSRDALYDFGDGWVPLVRQSRPRFETGATVYTRSFDGRLPATVWHRLLLDACIPPETSVAVESRAADDERELAGARWQPEPALTYHRSDGSELPYVPPPQGGGHETWEILFQRARGRFLELRLVLSGNGRATPRLAALRAYYPRFSYLERYLPKAYRDDTESASFLDRFLANLEGIETGIEDRIATAQALFDPRTAPADTLDWLLGWFDVLADPTWSEERRRVFLRHATEFFALRGTVAGIQLALRLALDEACDSESLFAPETVRNRTSRIIERYRTRRTPAVVLGDPTDSAGPRVVQATARWDPAQGGDVLRDRWRAFVGDPEADFPLDDPSERWRGFVRDVLGIDPPAGFAPALWTSFLATRYGRIDALNTAYGLVGAQAHESFDGFPYPQGLPPDGAALRDWYQFVALVLPARRAAHRFTVLLPMPPGDTAARSPDERRAIALRVVELQKPAHTTFDVKFFWAAFRLGEARLGDDTLLDLGSRDPRLRQPLVLGHEYAGESYLGGTPAPTAGHVGRDPLNR
jgi:phage tail-like protein